MTAGPLCKRDSDARWKYQAVIEHCRIPRLPPSPSSTLIRLSVRHGGTALTQMAARGDVDAIRTLATEALGSGDAVTAWQWQKLALLHGNDLTVSTMLAYHDEGERDGQFYDSNFGGGLCAAGDKGLELPFISKAQGAEAAKRARAIYQSAASRR